MSVMLSTCERQFSYWQNEKWCFSTENNGHLGRNNSLCKSVQWPLDDRGSALKLEQPTDRPTHFLRGISTLDEESPAYPLRLISEAREWGETLTLADLGWRLSRPKTAGSGSCFRGTKPYGSPRVTSTALGLSVLTPELRLPLQLRHSTGTSGFRSSRAWGPRRAVLWSPRNWGCEELTRMATQKRAPTSQPPAG